jgi:hypothetical protein
MQLNEKYLFCVYCGAKQGEVYSDKVMGNSYPFDSAFRNIQVFSLYLHTQ